jgi:hypothetical protein
MFPILSIAALRRGMMLCAVAALAVAQACGSDSTSSTSPRNNNPTGEYALRTVDGKGLPYQISRSPFFDASSGHFYNEYDVTVTAGIIELDELGLIDLWIDFAVVGDGVPGTKHLVASGTYAVQGSQVIATFNGAGSGQLPLQNGQIDIPMDVLGKGVTNHYDFKR